VVGRTLRLRRPWAIIGGMADRKERVRLAFAALDAGDMAPFTALFAPEWSGPVTLFKVFTFEPNEDVVVQLNDCIDESYALQMLAA